jgi:hypothetical protein
MGLMQSTPYGIHGVETAEQDADPHEVKGLGDHPKVLRARLDDGTILQVALTRIHPEMAPDRLLAEREQSVAEAKQNDREHVMNRSHQMAEARLLWCGHYLSEHSE